MLGSYVLGLVFIVVAVVVWVAVQTAWRRVFADMISDPDALAGRSGCGGCGCAVPCERQRSGPGPAALEEVQ